MGARQSRSQRTESLALARVALAAAAWGFVPLLVRAVHTSPLVIAFWRVALGALAFFLYFLARGRLGEVGRLDRRTTVGLVFLGVLLAVGWLLFFSAIVLAPVAVAVLITFTAPLFLAVLSPAFTGDPFDRRIVIPLLIALAGTLLIALPWGGGVIVEGRPGKQMLGAALALATAVVLAVMTAVQKRVLRRVAPDLVMFAQTAAAAVFLLPAAVILPGPTLRTEWAALAVLGFGLTTVPFLFFLSGLRRVRADRVGVVTYVEPLSAVVVASIFLGEPLTAATAVGGLAVVAGGLLVARLSSPRPRPVR
ncbi:MAG: DMT family transporter [Thermoleophilia bacterium]